MYDDDDDDDEGLSISCTVLTALSSQVQGGREQWSLAGGLMEKYVMVSLTALSPLVSQHHCIQDTTLSHPLTQIDFQADMLAGPAQWEAGALGLTRSDLV